MKISYTIKNIISITSVAVVFFGCNTENDPIPSKVPDLIPENEIIHIPVVVHVVNYAPNPFEISDKKILSQIDVLNEDYRMKNLDYTKTPVEFSSRVADVGIEFHLANFDPHGNPSTGIIRTESGVTGFDGLDVTENQPIDSLKLYFTELGGQDAWPNDKYLNIWIADLSDRNGNLALAGYAQFPGVDARKDGVVIDPRVLGTLPPLENGYELGRTATHEIGHWLNLLHIYGKDGDCEEGDLVGDTPDQLSQYQGNPTHPQSSCGSNDMFMNFMDRVNDDAMYMFTLGQKRRMRNLFNKGEARRQLYVNLRENRP